MAITLTQKLQVQLGNTKHKIFKIEDPGDTVAITVASMGMNYIKAAMFIALSMECCTNTDKLPGIKDLESSAGGTTISLSIEVSAPVGILKVWGY